MDMSQFVSALLVDGHWGSLLPVWVILSSALFTVFV
jgi:hypothetical protein